MNLASRSYPLTVSSRRRRRLIAALAAERAETQAKQDRSRTPQETMPAPVSASPPPAWILRSKPLTWILLGESLAPPPDGNRNWRNFGERLGEFLKPIRRRSRDVLIDKTAPRCDLTETRRRLADSLRFQPDVVLLSVGLKNIPRDAEELSRFEEGLRQFIKILQRTKANCILSTPPALPVINREETVDHLIFTEAIRAIAAECDLPLVDHWRRWEEASLRGNDLSKWCTNQGRTVGPAGHMELFRQIVEDLGLGQISDPSPSPGRQPAKAAHAIR